MEHPGDFSCRLHVRSRETLPVPETGETERERGPLLVYEVKTVRNGACGHGNMRRKVHHH